MGDSQELASIGLLLLLLLEGSVLQPQLVAHEVDHSHQMCGEQRQGLLLAA